MNFIFVLVGLTASYVNAESNSPSTVPSLDPWSQITAALADYSSPSQSPSILSTISNETPSGSNSTAILQGDADSSSPSQSPSILSTISNETPSVSNSTGSNETPSSNNSTTTLSGNNSTSSNETQSSGNTNTSNEISSQPPSLSPSIVLIESSSSAPTKEIPVSSARGENAEEKDYQANPGPSSSFLFLFLVSAAVTFFGVFGYKKMRQQNQNRGRTIEGSFRSTRDEIV